MINVIRNNKTLREMLVGITIVGITAEVLCLLFSKDVLFNCIGLAIGIAGAFFMVIHMAITIEDAVLLDEKGAIAYSRKMTCIRYAVICALVVATGVLKLGSPVMCVIGVLMLKFGAYLQPFVHRLSSKGDGQ